MKKLFISAVLTTFISLFVFPFAFAQLPIEQGKTGGQQILPAGGANTSGIGNGTGTGTGTGTAASGDYGLSYAQGIQGLAKGDIPTYVGGILNVVMGILGSILVALIIYSGVLYMTAAGNEKRVETAKTVLTYAIIGIVIVFASYVISQLVISAVTGVAPTTSPGTVPVK